MSPKRRILHCIASMAEGGAQRHMAYLCRGLGERGWDVTVALLDLGPNSAWLKAPGVRIELMRHRTNYDPRIVPQVVGLIRQLRPDIVHTWLPMMNIAGGLAAGISGRVLLGDEQNSGKAYGRSWKNSLRLLVLSTWATAVIANSAAGLEYMQSEIGRHVAKYVVRNGIPTADIEAVLPAERELMGVDRGAQVILFAGRFEAQKNISVLFDALPLVFKVHPQAVAILCGTGSMRGYWMDWVRQHGLQTKILFPGYVKDLWSWMKSVDVFVFPSLFEGQPNVVIEAMACGCPLIVSDISEHREFLDNDMALLVPPNDPRKIAGAIGETLENHSETAWRVANARARVAEYSIEAMVSSYEKIYLELIEAKCR